MNELNNPSPVAPLTAVDNALGIIELTADRARFILDIFEKEYSFREEEEPDCNAAYAAAHRIGGSQTRLERNSFKWVYEYGSALKLVNIANDLLSHMENELKTIRKELSDSIDRARAAQTNERSA